jgi:hypothetical protein
MDVALTLMAGIVPAVVSGLAAFFVADRRFKADPEHPSGPPEHPSGRGGT